MDLEIAKISPKMTKIWPKMDEILKNFRKIFRFFLQTHSRCIKTTHYILIYSTGTNVYEWNCQFLQFELPARVTGEGPNELGAISEKFDSQPYTSSYPAKWGLPYLVTTTEWAELTATSPVQLKRQKANHCWPALVTNVEDTQEGKLGFFSCEFDLHTSWHIMGLNPCVKEVSFREG